MTPELLDWAFKGLISIIAMYGISVLSKMKTSIDTLNVQVAVILNNNEWHEKLLKEHDERLGALESKE